MFKEKLKKAFMAALIAFLGALGGFSIPDDAFGQPGNYTIPHDHSTKGKGGTRIAPTHLVMGDPTTGPGCYFGDIGLAMGNTPAGQYSFFCLDANMQFNLTDGANSTGITPYGIGTDGLTVNDTFLASGDAQFDGEVLIDTANAYLQVGEIKVPVAGTFFENGNVIFRHESSDHEVRIMPLGVNGSGIYWFDDAENIDAYLTDDQFKVGGASISSAGTLILPKVVSGEIVVNGANVYGEREAIAETPEDRSSTTTVTVDDNISAGVGVDNGFWEYYGIVRFSTGSATPDLTFEFSFAGSVGSFSNDYCYITAYEVPAGTLLYKDYLAMDELSADIQLPAGENVVVEFKCLFEATGGTVNAYVAWAPQVSDASAVTRQVGSYSVVRQLQ